MAVYPRTITLMAGSTYRRFKGVGYDASSWEQGGEIPEYGISDASLGLIDARTGAFRAGDGASEGYVVVQVGERKGVARVRVTDELDKIRFPSDAIAVDSGATVTLQPELISDGESVTFSAEALDYQVDDAALCQVNPENGSVTTTRVQGESCTVTVSAAGRSAELTI
ncbi:MAG TPA: metallophosphoesterase, partial [Alcanivorax sp.]|nr:metallophosphoesterase [Alcanivorax sp.]